MLIAKSLLLFVLAGLCEIGGGYLVWLRGGQAVWAGAAGAAVLFAYGIVHTFQPAHFGRVYAAYGAIFLVIALLWGWGIDGRKPDVHDLAGAGMCLAGVFVMMYWPRGA